MKWLMKNEEVPATLGGTAIPRSRFDAQSVCRQAGHKGDPKESTTSCDQCGFINVPNQMILEIYSRSQRSGWEELILHLILAKRPRRYEEKGITNSKLQWNRRSLCSIYKSLARHIHIHFVSTAAHRSDHVAIGSVHQMPQLSSS